MNKEYMVKKAGVRWGVVFGVFVVCFLLGTKMIPSPVLKQDDDRVWHVVWEGSLAEATEANPGAGASGFLEVFLSISKRFIWIPLL